MNSMDEMRWLLLVIGIFIVLGIYLFDRWAARKIDLRSHDDQRKEPSINDKSPDDECIDVMKINSEPKESSFETETKPKPKHSKSGEQFVVTIRLVAINNATYAGDDLVLALREHGMQLGDHGIFHFFKDEDREIVFSAASLVEPGTFDLKKIKDQRIPGITFFMVLPTVLNGIEAFDEMISIVKKISYSLKGELLDESGSSFSIQRERYIREEVIEFLFQSKKVHI